MNHPVRTDLAIENAEMFQETEELQGISIHEETGKKSGIRITRVRVENETGAKKSEKILEIILRWRFRFWMRPM